MSATCVVRRDEVMAVELERLTAQRGITVLALVNGLVHPHALAEAPMPDVASP